MLARSRIPSYARTTKLFSSSSLRYANSPLRYSRKVAFIHSFANMSTDPTKYKLNHSMYVGTLRLTDWPGRGTACRANGTVMAGFG